MVHRGCGGTFEKEVDGANGTFKFKGKAIENVNHFSTQTVSLSFQLTNAHCHCDEVTFIQSVRITRADGSHIHPNAEQADRAEPNGWAVDRVAGAHFAWYPLNIPDLANPNGSYNPMWDTPGNNNTPAILKDEPGAGSGLWPLTFEFVSCAICRRGAANCQNRILKYVYWTFKIQADGRITDVDARIPTAPEKANVSTSQTRWNANAGALGKDPIPPLADFP